MAERRMLSRKIVESDDFLDMPLSTQALYTHMVVEADDDGFLNSPKKITRSIGASEDDFKLLIAKRFLLTFPSGVVCIKHWWIHNTKRKDRYKPTQYQEEYKALTIKENGAYTDGCQMGAKWLPDGCRKLTTTNTNKTNVVEDSDSEKWLSNRLTDEQWTKLDNQYQELLELIDYVDNLVDDVSNIKNPFKYIIAIAEKKNWPRRTAP